MMHVGVLTAIVFVITLLVTVSAISSIRGDDAFSRGLDLSAVGRHDQAADFFWTALVTADGATTYEVGDAFTQFLSTFSSRDMLDEGYLLIAKKYFSNNQMMEGSSFLQQALETNPQNEEARSFYTLYQAGDKAKVKERAIEQLQKDVKPKSDKKKKKSSKPDRDGSAGQEESDILKRIKEDPDNAELHYELGTHYFGDRRWTASLEQLQLAYDLDDSMTQALSTIVYLRASMAMWGVNGTQYEEDMRLLDGMVRREMSTTMLRVHDVSQQSVIHPHMTLGYPLAPELKLAVARSHARAELAVVLNARISPVNHSTPKRMKSLRKAAFGSDGLRAMAANQNNAPNEDGSVKRKDRNGYKRRSRDRDGQNQKRKGGPLASSNTINTPFAPGYRIKVGYVSANIKAKTTVYMAQDLFQFHNRDLFEVHVYATTPQDTTPFLSGSMRGVDWRSKVQHSVEYFHEVQDLDVRALAELIQSHDIHILLNWDGYSNNGVRATGLFPIQAAPIQIAHQEYIGTMGADYIQYLITDPVATPLEYDSYYHEKFIMLPNSFLANSFAYQAPHMSSPKKVIDSHNSPQSNGCGGQAASFVYCNFNKQLKFNPATFTTWLQVLQEVDGSVLCLLENPADSIPFIYDFVDEFDQSLHSRIRFQPFLNNPYDNQRRVGLMCNAVLDTPVYNGHTTAGDALWAGVPVVTLGTDIEMSGRVGASALTALGLPELITYSTSEYLDLAVALGSKPKLYKRLRNKLVSTSSQHNPKNAFWDLQSYVAHLEVGFESCWRRFLSGELPAHVIVSELLEAATADSTSTSTGARTSNKRDRKKGKRSRGGGIQNHAKGRKRKRSKRRGKKTD